MSKPLPTLYHRSKNGSIEVWKCWADGKSVVTEYGQLDGKMQISRKDFEAVNVGKSNERSAEEEAIFMAKSMWQFKLDRKYRTTIEEAKEQLFLPMLADKFSDGKVPPTSYPVSVQPKLDGVRCIAYWEDGKIELMSRSGKPYHVPHVQKMVAQFLPPDCLFDGELYVHGMSCQQITSIVKRHRKESEQLKYWVYDYPCSNVPWKDRFNELISVFKKAPEGHGKVVRTVRTQLANNDKEVWEWMKKYNAEGFEGAIVRRMDGLYEYGFRSKHLLKVKVFQDAEYLVTGAKSGVGKMENCAIFECVTPEGKTFDVTPKATMAERSRMWKEKDNYIGRMYTVRFFDLTDDKCPRFPVGIVFRDEKDLPLPNKSKPNKSKSECKTSPAFKDFIKNKQKPKPKQKTKDEPFFSFDD